jgi:hypothetical protein
MLNPSSRGSAVADRRSALSQTWSDRVLQHEQLSRPGETSRSPMLHRGVTHGVEALEALVSRTLLASVTREKNLLLRDNNDWITARMFLFTGSSPLLRGRSRKSTMHRHVPTESTFSPICRSGESGDCDIDLLVAVNTSSLKPKEMRSTNRSCGTLITHSTCLTKQRRTPTVKAQSQKRTFNYSSSASCLCVIRFGGVDRPYNPIGHDQPDDCPDIMQGTRQRPDCPKL